MYTISIENARFFVPIGIYKEEKILKNTIQIDCYLQYDYLPPSIKYLDYVQVINLLKNELNKGFDTLEECLEAIKNKIYEKYPFISLQIKICKINPPINEEIRAVCLEWRDKKYKDIQ